MISDKFFVPGLMHYLCSFIKGCHICQLARKDKPLTRQLQTRLYLNYRPLSILSMHLKVLPKSNKGHRFILCVIDCARAQSISKHVDAGQLNVPP